MKNLILYFKFCLLIVLLNGSNLYSQNRNELESNKKNNIEKIKFSRKLLQKTTLEKKRNISRINIISKSIEYRDKLVLNYEDELNLIESDISEIKLSIIEGEKSIDILKNEYANIIKASYRNSDNQFWLMFVLSSADLNQSYRRTKYLKYINNYRKELYQNIIDKNLELSNNIDSLEILKRDKNSTMNSVNTEKKLLVKDKNSKYSLQKELLSEEKRLKDEIKKNEGIQRKIESEIRKLIEEEAKKAILENRVNRLTPAEKIIDNEFSHNVGGLPWPTEQGIITNKFGLHKHAVLKGIKINSIGVDINTINDANVRAIFKGEVVKVVAILGANYTVIIKHGNYRTVYQNLVEVNVNVGDFVETKEYIGKLGTEGEDYSKLHFQLWKEREAINPEKWLSK